jgi:hypothetical protein
MMIFLEGTSAATKVSFSGSQQVVKFGPGVRQALPTHKMSILNYKNVILSISTRDEKEGSMLLTQRAE